jgi:hypothetical protein
MIADESDGNDDMDQMDDMVADIERRYDLDEDPPLEVLNFYRLLLPVKKKCTNHAIQTTIL